MNKFLAEIAISTDSLNGDALKKERSVHIGASYWSRLQIYTQSITNYHYYSIGHCMSFCESSKNFENFCISIKSTCEVTMVTNNDRLRTKRVAK